MRLGIIGLPQSGKTTIFNALTAAGAQVAAYPFTTIEPNVGVAVVFRATHAHPEDLASP